MEQNPNGLAEIYNGSAESRCVLRMLSVLGV